MTAAAQSGAVRQRRRALAHRCPACHALWALRLVLDPAAWQVECRCCGTRVQSVPRPRSAGRG